MHRITTSQQYQLPRVKTYLCSFPGGFESKLLTRSFACDESKSKKKFEEKEEEKHEPPVDLRAVCWERDKGWAQHNKHRENEKEQGPKYITLVRAIE